MRLTQSLDPRQRRLVLALCAAAACVATLSTSFFYLLAPIQETFSASDSQVAVMRQAPSVAALLVVFIAGALGPWVGERRFLLGSCVLFVAGCLLVAAAPVIQVATAGFLVANVGRTAMFIVGLGYLASVVRDPESRAAAFSLFAMVGPVVSIVMPVLAGSLSDTIGWRWVALTCACLGAVSAVVLARTVPRTPPDGERGELWTLALAGAILALVVDGLGSIANEGLLSAAVVVRVIAVGIATVVLVALARRLERPSLDLSLLRRGGFSVLLAVLMLLRVANLWFYTTMALQFVFGLNTMQTAIAMIPSQITGLAGAVLAGRLVQRYGISRAGFAFIVAIALSLWASMIVGAQSPTWVPIVAVSLYAVAEVGAGVPLTNAIMNRTVPGEEGDASAFRGAATNLGNALGVAVMTAIVVSAITMSLQHQYRAAGLDASSVGSLPIAREVQEGASTQQLSSQYAIPVSEVDTIDAIQVEAFVTGFRTQGFVGGALTLAMGVVFLVVTRRQERAGPPATGAPDSGLRP